MQRAIVSQGLSIEEGPVESCLRMAHLGKFRELSEELRALPLREIRTAVHILMVMEKEHPLSDSMSTDLKSKLAVTQTVGYLLESYDENIANMLLEAGYTFRDDFPARSMHHLLQISEVFRRENDCLSLAGAFAWIALLDSDRRDFSACLSHVWQSQACCQYILKNAQDDTPEWRNAVRWLAAVQHQMGIACRLLKDFKNALLYYHRSLALAQRISDWRRNWASEGSIANVFGDQGYVDRSLFHRLRSLAVCLRGLNSPEMAPTALSSCYETIGSSYEDAGDFEAAVQLCRKGYEVGFARRGLLETLCNSLCQLKKNSEAEIYFEELLRMPLPTRTELRFGRVMAMIAIARTLGKASVAIDLADELGTWMVRNRMLISIRDEQVRMGFMRRLESAPEDEHATRAVALFALGRVNEAGSEIDAGLAAAPASSRQIWLDMAKQLNLPESATASAGEKCRICGERAPASPGLNGGLCGSCQETLALDNMVLIPAGNATMPDGSTEFVPAFYIDRTLVTNRFFKLYHNAEQPSWKPAGWEHALRNIDSQPVSYVSRNDCEAFCEWRSKVAGRAFHLPSVAQWMRAALGDDGRKYPWGNSAPNHEQASFSLCEDDYAVPPPVGTFPAGASPFGVLDMAGTVFEWTSSNKDDGQPFHLGGACGTEESFLDPRYLLSMDLTPAAADARCHSDLGFRCVAEAGGGLAGAGESSKAGTL